MIRYDTFIDLCVAHNSRVRFLERFVDEVLATGPKGYVSNLLVGSAIKKMRSQDAFWGVLGCMTEEDVAKTFYKSDYDFAIKLDSFVIERLLRKYPSLKEKENEDSDEYGKERLLRRVYTITVGDLVSESPEILRSLESFDKNKIASAPKSIKTISKSPFGGILEDKNFLQQEIQFLFVKDLNAIKRLWENIPADTFALHFWKQSPSFIGKEALKAVFAIFEELAVRESFDKKVFKSLDTIGQAFPAVEIFVGQPQVGGEFAQEILQDLPPIVGEDF